MYRIIILILLAVALLGMAAQSTPPGVFAQQRAVMKATVKTSPTATPTTPSRFKWPLLHYNFSSFPPPGTTTIDQVMQWIVNNGFSSVRWTRGDKWFGVDAMAAHLPVRLKSEFGFTGDQWMYSFPSYLINDGSQAWSGGFFHAPGFDEASWLWHNPDGSANFSDRVIRYPFGGGSTTWEQFPDPRSSAMRNWLQDQIRQEMLRWGPAGTINIDYWDGQPWLSEVFTWDFAKGSSNGSYSGAAKPFTSAQANAWWQNIVPHIVAVRNYLNAQLGAGVIALTVDAIPSRGEFQNDTYNTRNSSTTPNISGSMIQSIEGSANEYNFCPFAGTDPKTMQWHRDRMWASTSQGKAYWHLTFLENTGAALTSWSRFNLAMNAILSHGKDVNQQRVVYTEWGNGTNNEIGMLQRIQALGIDVVGKRSLGDPVSGPNGAVGGYRNSDGNWERDFQGGKFTRVIANDSPNTRGGIPGFDGRFQ